MRAAPSLPKCLALLAVLAPTALANYETSAPNVVTIVVKSTVTTCPTVPPPPCSNAASTSSATPSHSGGSTAVTGTESSYGYSTYKTSSSVGTSSKSSSTSGSTYSTSASTATGTCTECKPSSSSSSISSYKTSTYSTTSTSSYKTSTYSTTSTSSYKTSTYSSSSTTSSQTNTYPTTSSTSSSSSSKSSYPSTLTTKTSTSSSSTSSSKSSTSSTKTSSSTSTSSKSTSSSSSSTSKKSTSSSTSSTSTKTTSSSSSSTTKSTTSSSTTSKTTTTSSSTSVTPPACTDYWLATAKHQGKAPYADAPNYKVFRNVQDYGAKGDGVHDDTWAINAAISDGVRCSPNGCNSTTKTPAVVYFPPGTYLVTSPIIDYYYTQIIGNPGCMPVIKASPNFKDRWVIDGDQYQSTGKLGWLSTNVFWRQIRNFVIDMTAVQPSIQVAGIHWPVGQATSLQNIVVKMSTAPGNQHQGLFIEEGSGGYLGDLVFYGGAQGLAVGNQQFTMRNLTFNQCDTAIAQAWDWGWTYKGLSINNCRVGIDMTNVGNGALTVGSIVLIDSDIANTPVGIRFGNSAATVSRFANNLVVENVRLSNVPVAIQGPDQKTVLAGSAGKTTIAAWSRGNRYTPNGPTFVEGNLTPNARPVGLLSGADFYERSKPQYENVPLSQFVSIRSAGAMGDGQTDDTAAINKALQSAAAAGKIVFFDAGDYVVTSTIYIPPSSRVVGEAYSVILSQGAYFADMSNPKPVVKVGAAGEVGVVEWSDMIVSTRGAQGGAILIEWNLSSPQTPSGMWDVHTRIGGFAGSNLQLADCPTQPNVKITTQNLNQNCIAAFMSMHVTPSASGLYMENVWLWVADHDVEDPKVTRITVYAGRGLLIEAAAGRIWAYGTAVEHHSRYQYHLTSTRDVILGQIQTESAYYQPNPDVTIPFPSSAEFNDPKGKPTESGWGLTVAHSTDVLIYGAGLYSFFDNYSTACSDEGSGETCQTRVFDVEQATVSLYNLNTVGVTNMVTYAGADVASYADNKDGFVQSLAVFRTS